MNRTLPPPPSRPGDLDAWLSAFFRSEMPDPWPSFQPPAERNAPPTLPAPRKVPGRWSLFRSRLALAASVGLLVLSGLALPGRLGESPKNPPAKIREGRADRENGKPPKLRESLEQTPDGTGIRLDSYDP
jgi:hypothetical protein